MAKLQAMTAALVLAACTSGSGMDTGAAKADTEAGTGPESRVADAALDAASDAALPTKPELRGLSAVWGSAGDDVWAVGEAGTLLHYDGTEWTLADSPTTAQLSAVGGSGSNDVWAVGASTVLHWDGNSWSDIFEGMNIEEMLLGVWAASADSVFMAGFTTDTSRGILRRWNGSEWSWAEIGRGAMWKVWGSGPTDVWLGGTGEMGTGFVARGDGATFAPVSYDGGSVRGIWGASSDDVWVVPYEGDAQHWDGSSWTAFPLPSESALTALTGSAPDDLWAVGLNGTILHWDGSSWTRMDAVTSAGLFSVWATSADDAWTVGEDGILLHWNGSDWREVTRM